MVSKITFNIMVSKITFTNTLKYQQKTKNCEKYLKNNQQTNFKSN